MQHAFYRTDMIRQLEQLAILAGFGDSLMQRAGEAAWQALYQHWPECRSITVVCGSGNNGGDGLVLAYLAHKGGVHVEIVLMDDPTKWLGSAYQAWQLCCQQNIAWQRWTGVLPKTDVIVDALLGIGLQKEVKATYQAAIQAINTMNLPVLSIDVPSGLDPNTGVPLGIAVCATVTVTFLGMKPGLVTGKGKHYTGTLLYSTLDLPIECYQSLQAAARSLDLSCLQQHLTRRPKYAYKQQLGHVLIVGGDYGMGGAVHLCAAAALHCGAGLVSVATRREHAWALVGACPEILSHGIEEPAELSSLIEKATVIVIGPGLGQTIWGMSLLQRVLESDVPLIVDADALNLLAKKPIVKTNWILTPHSGEAGRLLQCSSSDIEADRFHAVLALQERYQGVVVLKGPGSLIQTAIHKLPWICMEGNPGMAVAGMGDILSGIIAAFIAQGLSLEQATMLGVAIHAHAGDQLTSQYGERGLKASDMFLPLRDLVNPIK